MKFCEIVADEAAEQSDDGVGTSVVTQKFKGAKTIGGLRVLVARTLNHLLEAAGLPPLLAEIVC